MKSQKRTAKNSSVRLYPVGVRKRKNGKFCAEIKNPINKKMIWLGTFVTAEEASESYKSKKLEFESLMGVSENTNSLNGVRKRKNGKFCAEIKNPFNKKRIWLGTFITAEEASESYKSKKLEFEELMLAKSAKKGQNLEESDPESSSCDESEEKSLMGVAENTNSLNGAEEKSKNFAGEEEEEEIGDESDEELLMGTWVKISEDKEVKFSSKLGVPIVDNYGFLLGEFSVLDDLSIYM